MNRAKQVYTILFFLFSYFLFAVNFALYALKNCDVLNCTYLIIYLILCGVTWRFVNGCLFIIITIYYNLKLHLVYTMHFDNNV